MANDNHTIIQLRRTKKNFSDTAVRDEKLEYAEPALIRNANGEYLVIGDTDKSVADLKRFKAFDSTLVDNQVFVTSDQDILKRESGTVITPATNASKVEVTLDGKKTNIQDVINTFETTHKEMDKRITALDKEDADPTKGGRVQKLEHKTTPQKTTDQEFVVIGYSESAKENYWYNEAVRVNSLGQLKGAAWNDFAEFRDAADDILLLQPGDVVCEVGDGKVERSHKRLQPGAYVISDTYGMVIGEEGENSVPVAVAGRVLVRAPVDENFKVGDAVTADEFGMITKMTRLEIMLFPDRILGYVSEIPTYDKWNGVEVGYRIWIKVK